MTEHKTLKNKAQSVLDRLRNLARLEQREFQAILLLYAQERFLARMASSPYKQHFSLKGGMFLYSRYRQSARPTQDMDFAGRNTSNQIEDILEQMREILSLDLDDGVVFDTSNLSGSRIAEESKYAGVRIKTEARIVQAKLPITLDVGFGDVISPAPVLQSYPNLLDNAPFELFTITLETLIAEKFQAMIMLGERNTRIKDFYDLYRIASTETLNPERLRTALERTFKQRETSLEAARAFLVQGYVDSTNRQQLWEGYLRRSKLDAPKDFNEVMQGIRAMINKVL